VSGNAVEILFAVVDLESKEKLSEILDETVPAAIQDIASKNNVTFEKIAKSEQFVGKILALPAEKILEHARLDSKVIVALTYAIATMAYRGNGVKIYGKTYRASV
jgi:hypothetical protein